MTNMPSRLIGLVLAFIIMVFGPLTVQTMTQDLTMRRTVMNEMANLIDKVTDTGELTDMQLADFYLGIASNGAVLDADIKRYVKVVNPDGAGGIYTTYTVADNISTWNKGDYIQVTVKAIDRTGAQKLLWGFLHLVTPDFEVTFSGRVRS